MVVLEIARYDDGVGDHAAVRSEASAIRSRERSDRVVDTPVALGGRAGAVEWIDNPHLLTKHLGAIGRADPREVSLGIDC